jgi:hypothetical protein
MDKIPVEKKPVTTAAPAKKKVAAKKVVKPVYEPNIRIGTLVAGLFGMAYVVIQQTELFAIPDLVVSLIDNDLFTISAAVFLVSLFSIKTKK